MVQTSDFKPSKLKLHSNIEHFTECFFLPLYDWKDQTPMLIHLFGCYFIDIKDV
jgi:hypothetical protein